MNDHPDLDLGPSNNESTDDRLRRLEAAIAAMQDTQLMEQRLLERVSERLNTSAAPPTGDSHAIVEAGNAVLPGMLRAVGSQFNAATSPTAPPSSSLFSARTWIVTDIIQEVRTFFVMYFDYRYQVTLTARIVPLAAMVIFILGWVLKSFTADNFFGAALQHLTNLVLVVIVYKTMQREAARYRAHFAYLPPI
jgi:hypothetical protein